MLYSARSVGSDIEAGVHHCRCLQLPRPQTREGLEGRGHGIGTLQWDLLGFSGATALTAATELGSLSEKRPQHHWVQLPRALFRPSPQGDANMAHTPTAAPHTQGGAAKNLLADDGLANHVCPQAEYYPAKITRKRGAPQAWGAHHRQRPRTVLLLTWLSTQAGPQRRRVSRRQGFWGLGEDSRRQAPFLGDAHALEWTAVMAAQLRDTVNPGMTHFQQSAA